jgi:hypothetical protein
MIDHPATAHDAGWASRTNSKLRRIARGASRTCRQQFGKIERAVSNLDLNAKSKRKRILDALAPTYYRC